MRFWKRQNYEDNKKNQWLSGLEEGKEEVDHRGLLYK